MKRKRQRYLAILLCTVMLVSCSPKTAESASETSQPTNTTVAPVTEVTTTVVETISTSESASSKNTDKNSNDIKGSENTEGKLSREKKLQIISYINGIMDPLNENSSLSDEYLEKKCEEVWLDAEKIYNVTEEDIAEIMLDADIVKEYYQSH